MGRGSWAMSKGGVRVSLACVWRIGANRGCVHAQGLEEWEGFVQVKVADALDRFREMER